MLGLNGALAVASKALQAQYAGLAVTNNNIANVNTPGYSRQIVSLSADAMVQNGTSVNLGVTYTGYTSVRDSVLNTAINDKTSSQAGLNAQSTLLSQVDAAFSDTTGGVGGGMSGLFSSISALSTNPADSSLRQAVLTSANQLVNGFHQGAAALSSASANANQQVITSVAQVNQLTTQIAALNSQLASVQTGTGDGGGLQDQRDQLTTQLAALTGIATIQTDATPTVTTTSGTPLVVGTSASMLQVTTAANGQARILDTFGNDLTSTFTSGILGGLLNARDATLPALSKQLGTLATQFADAMNAAHTAGTDADGSAGGALFTIPTGSSDAAAAISVAVTDPRKIAASSDGAAGSNGNLAKLLAVQTNTLAAGSTPSATYAGIVYSVGAASAQASSDLTSTTASLTQLTSQRDSQSGVSVDEEATNLIRFQQGYQAAARVISTLSECYSVLMNMGGN